MTTKEKVLDARGKPRVQTVRPKDEEIHTVQSDAHLADIQNIMAQYSKTGMESLDETELQFKDVSEFTDLGDALRQAEVARVQFMRLPSKVREVFNHDVAQWLDTAHDDDKREVLIEMGILEAPEVEKKPETVPIKGTEEKVIEPPPEGVVEDPPK